MQHKIENMVAISFQPTKKTRTTKKLYTLEEYLLREEISLTKNEYFNGKIIPMAGGKYNHNQIAAQISSALIVALKGLEKKYKVCNSDQKVYIASDNIGVYPDAIVICEKPEFWQGRKDLVTNPIVIVEVLSKSTAAYDKGGKFLLYQKLPSFKEYILIEQDFTYVESWCQIKENTWEKTFENKLDAQLEIRSLGISVSLSDIYDDVEFE